MHTVRIVNTNKPVASGNQTMAKPTRCAVIAHVPPDLRRKLDAAAKKSRRSRSAELQVRIEESLRRFVVMPGVAAGDGT
jgi:hypothetical protein